MKALVEQLSAGSLRSTKRSTKRSSKRDVAASDVGLSIETHASSGQLYSAELGGGGPSAAHAAPSQGARSVDTVRKPVTLNRKTVRYHMLLAAEVRITTRKTLPALQSLLEDPETHEWIVEVEMSFDAGCLGEYRKKFGVVSHRWLTDHAKGDPRRAPPDPDGVQLAALKQWLNDNPDIEYVWMDWPCMYQSGKDGEREPTDAERAAFKVMLSEVNMLYISCQVLILLDNGYIGRFWTNYEGWLSMREPTAEGLTAAPEATRRYTIMPILSANKMFGKALETMLGPLTPEDAMEMLKNDDIVVTNQSDKEGQLAKLATLDARVRTAFRRQSMTQEEVLQERVEELEQMVRERDEEIAQLKALLPLPAAQVSTKLACDLAEAKAQAYMCQEVRAAGFTCTEAKKAGYDSAECKAGGYSLTELLEAGFTLAEVKKAGFPLSELKRTGNYSRVAIREAGYTCDEAKAAGYIATIAQAKAAGFVEGLKSAGYTCAEAEAGGLHVRGGEAGGLHVRGGEAGGLHVRGGEAGGLHVRGGEAGGLHVRGGEAGGLHVRGGEAGGLHVRGG